MAWIGILLFGVGLVLPFFVAFTIEWLNRTRPLSFRGAGIEVEFSSDRSLFLGGGGPRPRIANVKVFQADMTNIYTFPSGASAIQASSDEEVIILGVKKYLSERLAKASRNSRGRDT
jgi:hypothetical protein